MTKIELIAMVNNHEEIDMDVRLSSDAEVEFGRTGCYLKVDTIFLIYDGSWARCPKFRGYAHNSRGEYDWDYLTAEDFEDIDLEEYMDGSDITNLVGLIQDHPEIFYLEEV